MTTRDDTPTRTAVAGAAFVFAGAGSTRGSLSLAFTGLGGATMPTAAAGAFAISSLSAATIAGPARAGTAATGTVVAAMLSPAAPSVASGATAETPACSQAGGDSAVVTTTLPVSDTRIT